jgi:uncharacterized membrane protein YheB (UPF0754 family)
MGSDQSLKGNDIMEKTKVTQKMALGYVLENCEVPADIKEKLEKMLEQVEKKASGGSKSMSATQKANAELAEKIVGEMEENRLYTVTEMLKVLPCLAEEEYTNQKISAIMSNLVKELKVERVVDKRKSYFKVVGE